MNYLVVGPTIVNDVVFEDGRVSKRHLGGAVFSLAGIKVWSDDCLYISHVGSDFDAFYGKWMQDNRFSSEGLQLTLPHTQYTQLTYGAQGLFTEESIYGTQEDDLVFSLDKPDAGWIAQHCDAGTKGIYIEAEEDDSVWTQLEEIRSKGDLQIMWELPTSCALDAERRSAVLSTICTVGLFSVNLPEAMGLFSAPDEETAIERILAYGVPCFLRAGAKGSYFLCDGVAHFAPSVTVGAIVDPTGCGNCSTAAALYGYCEGYPPQAVAMIGNISAAFNLLQFGPYPCLTAEVRSQAHKLLEGFTRG